MPAVIRRRKRRGFILERLLVTSDQTAVDESARSESKSRLSQTNARYDRGTQRPLSSEVVC
jgi:hypothetical protein